MAYNGSGTAAGSDGPLMKRLRQQHPSDVENVMSHQNNSNDELRRKRQESARPNHILLFTIINPVYPITVDVLYTISSPHGQVQRIVIFKKNGVQAMVEFESLESATRARDLLNGADIYTGCCTLKIDYAKPEKLNVFKNDTDLSWDYTLTAVREVVGNTGRSPLLQDPLFGNRPQAYNYISYDNNMNFQEPPLLGPGAAFPPYGAQDFHQAAAAAGAITAANDPWKAAAVVAGHQGAGLMKDPPGVRNGPPPFITQGQQQGSVMMVYGLDNDTSNTDKLFNLICLYGNVARIKFLKTKEGTAMVQMGDAVAVERCVQQLNNIPIGNDGARIQIAFSKQNFLSEVTNPFSLPDNSPSFKEYTGSKNNRFLSAAQASKNRIQPPSKILHFFNTPPGLTEEELSNILKTKDITPTAVRMFPLKTDRSSSGLIEFPNVSQAVLAIMKCNHVPVESKGTKFPFIMKLCFSSSRNMNTAWIMGNNNSSNNNNNNNNNINNNSNNSNNNNAINSNSNTENDVVMIKEDN